MGWSSYHLFMFDVDGVTYSTDYNSKGGAGIESDAPARRHTLKATLGPEGRVFEYTYDFGDFWEHRLTVESLDCGVAMPAPGGPAEGGHPLAVCMAGRGACPPEDIGGVWGFKRLKEVLALPEPEEGEEDDLDEEELEVFGDYLYEGWDPNAFTVEQANRRISYRMDEAFRKAGKGPGYEPRRP
jgi:hypothetical protein